MTGCSIKATKRNNMHINNTQKEKKKIIKPQRRRNVQIYTFKRDYQILTTAQVFATSVKSKMVKSTIE